MNKARRLQKWFLRYGLTKDERVLVEKYQHGREAIWFVLLHTVRRAYNKGYKDGREFGITYGKKRSVDSVYD